jgi:diguanylate cyclase (GGDEF) domain
MTTCDTLTGLLDSASFVNTVDSLMKRTTVPQAIIFSDIENFKSFNMTYTMYEGNMLLRYIGRTLCTVFNGRYVARFGDDHFVVVCPKDEAEDGLHHLHIMVSESENYRNVKLKSGLCELKQSDDVMTICDMARIACISIKGNYDKDFLWYDSKLSATLMTRRYVIDHMQEAIDNGWIVAYYQPIMRAMTEQVAGLEALCRWNDPKYGMLRPDQFIETLEEAHLIHHVDLAILDQVCAGMRKVMDAGNNPVPCSINLSRLDFILCDIFKEVNSTLERYNIPHSLIDVEVTERALSEDDGSLRNTLDAFHEAGYKLWMDDFGSEYSSLNSLKDYDFDVIKIDMKFLSAKATHNIKKSKVIIASIVDMAKKLGIHTLCEGVETKENLDFLKEVGCEKIQGYYFSKPLSYSDLREHFGAVREQPNDREYMEQIGRINILARNPIQWSNYDDSPMVLFEYDGKELHLRNSNAAFSKSLYGVDKDPKMVDSYLNNINTKLMKQFVSAAEQSKKNTSPRNC